MILRKPYAFLIKYFRVINIAMFVFFVYLIFPLRQIYMFFSDYISGNNYMYFENMATKYVSPLMFIVVLLLFAFGIGIFFLMRKKEKPVLYYKLVITYAFILFGILIYFFVFFKSLSNTNYAPLRIVINRDIIMAIYYLNFIFVGFSFIRGFGFDIKKFSFEKDRRELKLEASDNEEYELNINVEKEDVVNYVRKQRRELSYYFKENSKFYIIVGSIILVTLILYFTYTHFVVNKVYKQNQTITHGNISYTVTKSTITTLDKYGKEISDKYDFLIVYLNIKNTGKKTVLNDQQFRVNVSDEYYYPVSGYCSLFDDLGQCYLDSNISSNSNKDYILVYKILKKHSKIIFEILKGTGKYEYNKVKLSFNNDYKETVNYNINDVIKMNDNEYQITSFSLLNKTSFEYQECNGDKCNKYTRIVTPKIGNQVLEIAISNANTLTDDFIDNYFGLEYQNNILHGSDIEFIAKSEKAIYLGVPSKIDEEDKISLIISTRNKQYNILLKDGISNE